MRPILNTNWGLQGNSQRKETAIFNMMYQTHESLAITGSEQALAELAVLLWQV